MPCLVPYFSQAHLTNILFVFTYLSFLLTDSPKEGIFVYLSFATIPVDQTNVRDIIDAQKLFSKLMNQCAGQETAARTRHGTIGLVPNWEGSTLRLYIVAWLI